MREYIIEIPDYVPPFDPFARAATLGEEIVRCKDCKRVTIDQGDHDYREPLWCGLHRMDVCLDGFCAWGERRNA